MRNEKSQKEEAVVPTKGAVLGCLMARSRSVHIEVHHHRSAQLARRAGALVRCHTTRDALSPPDRRVLTHR